MENRDIIGYKGVYTIDEEGNVYSIRYKRFLPTVERSDGLYVQLYKQERPKFFKVEDLLKKHFPEYYIEGVLIDLPDMILTLSETYNLLDSYFKSSDSLIYNSLMEHLKSDKQNIFKGYVTKERVFRSFLSIKEKIILIKLLIINYVRERTSIRSKKKI